MPDFLPFAGIRYDAARLAGSAGPVADVRSVAAPPYDVIDEDDRSALEAADAHNCVRLLLPRDDAGRDRYQVAADALASWRDAGVLVADTRPRFYVYGMEYDDEDGRPRHTRGVIGALRLPTEPGPGTVIPHERTLPKAKSDRLALLRATRANLDPIWCLSPAAGLTDRLEAQAGEVLAECVDGEGVRHRLRAVDADTARITDAVRGAPLMIADGHHRFETACAYRDELAAAGRVDPGVDRIMTFVVELSEEELCVRPIHRVLTSLGGATDLRAGLMDAFDVTDAGANTPEGVASLRHRMTTAGGLGLVDAGGLAFLRPRTGALAAALESVEEPLRAVDATLFEVAVNPRLPESAEVAYRADAAVVAALVEKRAADAAVLLRPVTVPQIREAAAAGLRMPQKTTFFHPKPRTGMVFRSLDA